MIYRIRKSLFSIIILLCGITPAAAGASLAERVVVVVNQNQPDSIALGEYYAERRDIPAVNIVRLDAPTRETISWAEFIETIHNPLQGWLIREGWFDGITTTLTDGEGRHRNMIHGNRVSYLVLCRGIPLRVANDPERITEEHRATIPKQFQTTAGSVDSELAMLSTPGYPITGVLQNPLFQNANPTDNARNRVVKVARLDGPTHQAAKALIDDAIETEKTGLLGRAYIDISGPHETGNGGLRQSANLIRQAGFPVTLHENNGVFPIESRFDAPALYFGWYATDITGPFLTEGFRFARGAIAFHIHSFSASTLRSDSKAWCGPFVARGAAVTMGNVYEPYLQFTHRPQLFLQRLAAGDNVGDAAYHALPALSWQAVLIGDPLYRPFDVPLDEQIARLDRTENNPLGGYAYLRKLRELADEGRRRDALEIGRRGMNRHPNLALAIGLAELQILVRDNPGALETLNVVRQLNSISPRNALLAKEAADLLGNTLHEHRQALGVYETILKETRLPEPVRRALLSDAILLAMRTGQSSQAGKWRAELDRFGDNTGR